MYTHFLFQGRDGPDGKGPIFFEIWKFFVFKNGEMGSNLGPFRSVLYCSDSDSDSEFLLVLFKTPG